MQQVSGPSTELTTHTLQFTGSGADYFKCWIHGLFLSVITLGLYSPWATVAQRQYLARHTLLGGKRFDEQGRPWRILMVRVVVALALLWYVAHADNVLKLPFVALPALLAFSMLQRPFSFRARSAASSLGGVRFRPKGSTLAAYLVFLLPCVCLLPLAMPSLTFFLGVSLVMLALWPGMHFLIRRYQQNHLQYGAVEAHSTVRCLHFYLAYAKTAALTVLVLANAVALLALAMRLASWLDLPTLHVEARSNGSVVMYLIGGCILALLWGPYLRASLSRATWSTTRFPGGRFQSTITGLVYMRLQLRNAILVIISLGLYYPFAVVNTYRHRLAHLRVDAALALPDGAENLPPAMPPARWRHAVAALLVLAAALTLFFIVGRGALAEKVFASLPATADLRVGEAALQALKDSHRIRLDGEALDVPADVQEIFQRILPAQTGRSPRLIVVDMAYPDTSIYALPDGTILISKRMLDHMASYQREFDAEGRATLAAVLAHELGHLAYRHNMHSALHSSLPALLSTALTGNFVQLASLSPALLLDPHYSAQMEAQADAYAATLMQRAGLSMCPLAGNYSSLESDVPYDERNDPSWMASGIYYIRTHPASAARLARLCPEGGLNSERAPVSVASFQRPR